MIYIYKKRDLHKPVIESVQMKDYLLVRVGMNVGENRWFTHSFTPTGTAMSSDAERTFPADDSQRQRSADGSQSKQEDLRTGDTLKARLRKIWESRSRRKIQNQQKRQLQEIREQAHMEIQSFLDQLGTCVDDRYECRCVYADAVRSCLVHTEDWEKRKSEADFRNKDDIVAARWLPMLWKQCWQFPEFDAFLQPQWVEPLLEYARLHHYVVLGAAGSTAAAIRHCASRMKSLRWFLQERDCGQEIQDFVEDFYGEYGLAVSMQPLEGERAFSRLLLETLEPVCVLDFTGEPRIPAGGLARGSVWLDFCSIEEKARRMTEREEGISYFSLKEIWKHAGKS